MKRLISIIALLAIVFVAGPVWAADLAWDYPSDWAEIEGYIVYFNETGETDNPHIKNVAKTDLVEDGVTVTYAGSEPKLNLQIGQTYDLFITAWNEAGESGASNIVVYEMPAAYQPPSDNLPSGTVIEIPNASVTIRVQ